MRKLLVAALAVGAFLVPPAGALGETITVDVDDTLYSDGEVAKITGTVTCPEGRWRIDWIVVSGGVTNFFADTGKCTGAPTRLGMMMTESESGFSAGPVRVEGEIVATNRNSDYGDLLTFGEDVQLVIR